MGPLRPTYRSLLRLTLILFAASALGCAAWVAPGHYPGSPYYGPHGHGHRYSGYGYAPYGHSYYRRPAYVVPYPVYRSRGHHGHDHRHDSHDRGDRHDGRGHRGGSHYDGDSRGDYGRARGVETSRPPTRDGVGSRRSRDPREARAESGEAAVEPSSLPGRIDRRPSYGGRRGSDAQGTRRAPPASMGSGPSLRR